MVRLPKPALAPFKSRRNSLAGSLALAVLLLYPAWSSAGDASSAGAGTLLQGTLHDEGKLNPSLKVVPGLDLNGRAGTVNIQQYAAAGIYHPGEAAPIPPKPAVKPEVLTAGRGVVPVPILVPVAVPAKPVPVKPPPKWDYTATPKSGIMTWTPGSSVKVLQPLAPAAKPAPKSVFQPPATTRQPDWREIFARTGLRLEQFGWVGSKHLFPAAPATAVAPRVVPLMATPQLLSSAASAKQAAPSTWSEWYQRVSKAIYDQWQRSATGPGDARVRVTVWRTHDVDCQIMDFAPAADVKRNADSETQFREKAIQCVYSLRKCEILGFPYRTAKSNVTFELDMKRAVNGKTGCDFGEISQKNAKL